LKQVNDFLVAGQPNGGRAVRLSTAHTGGPVAVATKPPVPAAPYGRPVGAEGGQGAPPLAGSADMVRTGCPGSDGQQDSGAARQQDKRSGRLVGY